ncbi:MAG: hypothetical protein J0L70_06870 [Leptolyngbya sp. UWPOB_LEPTO1]|uniref:hypothetical protein n=1 Tax=Leptolyngbya sp. UWPOB_LEPTO1 TaxID=2815653 RepID=UPI001ACD3646|nr:hypothetical protein [Leptolyngbya sp. UWPOB_LEPTO1]MBN8560225.1 hypothetical protein [Leptolyngbya sp. UWPOB_LEPTO1]
MALFAGGGWQDIRHTEVDAARLLLILNQFGVAIDDFCAQLQCYPTYPVVRYFTPEYKLQKLDFLLRYPTYFSYELIELYRLRVPAASDGEEIKQLVRGILSDQEPDRRTDLYRKFFRGAYERLDRVEAWWYSRQLVYSRTEPRGNARPVKYYFLTDKVDTVVTHLVSHIPHAAWYEKRIQLIDKYFGEFSAEQLKNRQYTHAPYQNAQLSEMIPDLSPTELISHFEQTFEEPIGVNFE